MNATNETETKHTPGPWWVDGNRIRAKVFDEPCIATVFEDEASPGDPYLIAAAPELLEALTTVAAACRDSFCKSDPSGTVTLADCMDQDGGDTFELRLTLTQANAIADAITKATGISNVRS